MSLYTKLTTILAPDRPSLDITRAVTTTTGGNTSVYQTGAGGITEKIGPDLDAASASTLADLRNALATYVRLCVKRERLKE